MGEISGEEAAMLAALIYRPKLQQDWIKIKNQKRTVKNLIFSIEKELATQQDTADFGAQMTKAEFQEVLNQIKASKTLMSLEVENIESNDRTHFRAMTLKPTANGQNSQ